MDELQKICKTSRSEKPRRLDAWGSLDALIGYLRAAYEENGGKPEANLFGARAVRLYLREVRDSQAKARGILALPLDGDDVRCEAFGPWRSSFADKYGLSSPSKNIFAKIEDWYLRIVN